MAVPNFADIAKASNDLLNRDFYHLSAGTLEVKSNTPNNVAFKVNGKNSHEKNTAGTVNIGVGHWEKDAQRPGSTERLRREEGEGQCGQHRWAPWPTTRRLVMVVDGDIVDLDPVMFVVTHIEGKYTDKSLGLTVTQSWNTANALESKLELADSLAKGLKAEGVFSFLPATQARGAKFNLHFKQSSFHGRAFFDLLKGPTANVDAVIGHDGFLAGASAGYDVNKAAVTGYSAAIGYQAPTYSAAVTASDNLSIFAASYHHKVNSQVEAAAKATWNSKTGNAVGLEVATKYRLDPLSFVKAKINDRGVAAVAYNVLLREGVTFGIGASFDTQKLDQATHKVGTSFTFEA
ncbi:outer mitochondrial membrane protein porin [Ophiostoma piceae UAMH 11346]|uniref:Outer mitochondrial membrane protein porin n=1 Tax=Ophiostoma piceae (strain UAMH 11346) TaxID=1262450 RepID=S3D4J8_OPHP1|nr:outer mitochondrial membrane protein porin [Ophiostoma piceae UAMH 11346]